MRRPFLLPLLLLALPATAGAQVGIGAPAAAGNTPVRAGDGERVGRLLVERIGEDVTATARFRGRPPAKRATLCVAVGGDERCTTERVGDDGAVVLERTGAFTAVLRARVRCGDARGALRL